MPPARFRRWHRARCSSRQLLDQAGTNQQVRLDVVVEVGRSGPSTMTTGDHRGERQGQCDKATDPWRHHLSTGVLDQNLDPASAELREHEGLLRRRRCQPTPIIPAVVLVELLEQVGVCFDHPYEVRPVRRSARAVCTEKPVFELADEFFGATDEGHAKYKSRTSCRARPSCSAAASSRPSSHEPTREDNISASSEGRRRWPSTSRAAATAFSTGP